MSLVGNILKFKTIPNEILGLILDRTTYNAYVNLLTSDTTTTYHKIFIVNPVQPTVRTSPEDIGTTNER